MAVFDGYPVVSPGYAVFLETPLAKTELMRTNNCQVKPGSSQKYYPRQGAPDTLYEQSTRMHVDPIYCGLS